MRIFLSSASFYISGIFIQARAHCYNSVARSLEGTDSGELNSPLKLKPGELVELSTYKQKS